jgi:hypothetical protein
LNAVFNSSPVIFLSKLNLLEPSFSLFRKNYVPADVIDEITYGELKVTGKIKDIPTKSMHCEEIK